MLSPEAESFGVGSPRHAASLALPVKGTAAASPWICVTSDAPTFRMFIKNNGNKGHMDGQLAVLSQFHRGERQRPTGEDRRADLEDARVDANEADLVHSVHLDDRWKNGYANISFTIKPNDDHGNWQLDDFYVDPYKSG